VELEDVELKDEENVVDVKENVGKLVLVKVNV